MFRFVQRSVECKKSSKDYFSSVLARAMNKERAMMIKVGFLRINRQKELIKCLPFRCKSKLSLEAVAKEVMNWGKLTPFIS